jgi:hypothetical protein
MALRHLKGHFSVSDSPLTAGAYLQVVTVRGKNWDPESSAILRLSEVTTGRALACSESESESSESSLY